MVQALPAARFRSTGLPRSKPVAPAVCQQRIELLLGAGKDKLGVCRTPRNQIERRLSESVRSTHSSERMRRKPNKDFHPSARRAIVERFWFVWAVLGGVFVATIVALVMRYVG